MAVPGLTELSSGVFVFAVPGPVPVNSGIVVGDDGVCVIDSGTTEADARSILDAVAAVSDRPVRYVVNTHHHGDHSFGNWWFRPAIVVGHARCRLRLLGDVGESHKAAIARLIPMASEQVLSVPLHPPQTTFDESCTLHLGTTVLSLRYFGRAHTDNDIAVALSDRNINFAGDLIEESAPPVAFDGFPGEWGDTLRRLAAQPPSTFVPGHGRPVDRSFVLEQGRAFDELAAACRSVAAAGGNEQDALAALSDHSRAVLGAQTTVAVRRFFATADCNTADGN